MKYKRIFLYSFIPALLLFFLASIWYYRLPYYKRLNSDVIVIVYQVKYRSIIAPNDKLVEYIAISVIKDKVLIDVITGSGLENSIRLDGKEAKNFLKYCDISITEVDNKSKDDGG